MNEAEVVSFISLLLYLSLAIVGGRYYWKFVQLRIARFTSPLPRVLYDGPKEWFFFILTITALLDLPLPIGCLYEGGPKNCEWDSISYPIGWYLHILSIVGYAYTIMVPCILWNDIMTGGNGYLFPTTLHSCISSLSINSFITTSSSVLNIHSLSSNASSPIKIFLRILFIGFICNTSIAIIEGMILFRIHDSAHFRTNIVEYNVSVVIEVILICCITIACFISGIMLQLFVNKQEQSRYPKDSLSSTFIGGTTIRKGDTSLAKESAMGTVKAHRILCYLNLPMAVIVITYLIRGLFELKFVSWMPIAYRDTFQCSFLIWTLLVKWLPYGCCSYVLIGIMRKSGTERRKMKMITRSNLDIEYNVVNSVDDMVITKSLLDDYSDDNSNI